MKKFATAILLLIAGVIVLLANPQLTKSLSFGTEIVDLRKEFEGEAVRFIEIESDSTDVQVVRGTGSRIEAALVGKASERYLSRLKLNTEVKDGRLTVEPVIADNGWSFGINVLSVDMVITLPDKMWEAVELQVGSGNVEVSELNAKTIKASVRSGNASVSSIQAEEVELGLESGNLRFEAVDAKEITTRTSSGNTSGATYSANMLQFDTGSGNVTLSDGSGVLKGETGSGNIVVKTESIIHDMELESGSGNVTVQLAGEPKSLAFELTAYSGRSRVAWPYQSLDGDGEEDETYRSGIFGDGAVRLVAKSSSGNVTLKER